MQDQAKSENLILFMDREEEKQRQAKPIIADVERLADTMAGPSQQTATTEQQQTPPPPVVPAAIIPMDTSSAETGAEKIQGDISMGDDGAQTEGDKEDVEIEEA